MRELITHGQKLLELCRSMEHDQVVHCILDSKEMNSYINKITSDKDTATQVMHDTILSFIRSCMKEDFAFKKTPVAYMKSIAKYTNIRLERKRDKISTIEFVDYKIEPEIYKVDYDLKETIEGLLHKISEDCREILLLWALKYRMLEIAEKLDYNSESYVKKKKHLCLKKLIRVVDDNPKLKEELKL